jgi:hypothetical protein
MATDEPSLRERAARAMYEAWVRKHSPQFGYWGDGDPFDDLTVREAWLGHADAALAVPDIRRALAMAAVVDAEPHRNWISPAAMARNDLLARIKAADAAIDTGGMQS